MKDFYQRVIEIVCLPFNYYKFHRSRFPRKK